MKLISQTRAPKTSFLPAVADWAHPFGCVTCHAVFELDADDFVAPEPAMNGGFKLFPVHLEVKCPVCGGSCWFPAYAAPVEVKSYLEAKRDGLLAADENVAGQKAKKQKQTPLSATVAGDQPVVKPRR